jgi:hypothetical protein
VQARRREGLREALEALAVGGHHDLEPTIARRELRQAGDQLDEPAAQRRLAAGEAHPLDPAAGEGRHDLLDLLEAEQLGARAVVRGPAPGMQYVQR